MLCPWQRSPGAAAVTDTWLWGGMEGSTRGHLKFGQGDARVVLKQTLHGSATRAAAAPLPGLAVPASLAVGVLLLTGGADPAAATPGHRRGPVTRDT